MQYVNEKINHPKDYHNDIYSLYYAVTAYWQCIENVGHKNKGKNTLYGKAQKGFVQKINHKWIRLEKTVVTQECDGAKPVRKIEKNNK